MLRARYRGRRVPRIEAWLSDSELITYDASGFDVHDEQLLDLRSRGRSPWSGAEGMRPFDWTVADGSLFYTTDEGVGEAYRTTLHARGLRTGVVRDVASARSILCPRVSRDGARIAYVGVTDRDSVWVLERGGTRTSVFTGEAGGKSGGFLFWSPDGARLALRYTDRPNVIVDARGAGAPIMLPARFAAWLGDREVVLQKGPDCVGMDLDTGKPTFELRDATDAVVLTPP